MSRRFIAAVIVMAAAAISTAYLVHSIPGFRPAPSLSPPPSAASGLPAAAAASLQAGDLVFRIGNDWQSEAVRHAPGSSRGDPYSHVGMLTGTPGRWQVLHAVPAEAPGRGDAIRIDPLDDFLAPEHSRGVAVYRVDADPAQRESAVRHALARQGLPFRIVEDDPDGSYCTTLVWHAWRAAGVDLGVRFEYLDLPLLSGHYLLPHRLRQSARLQLLYESPREAAPA